MILKSYCEEMQMITVMRSANKNATVGMAQKQRTCVQQYIDMSPVFSFAVIGTFI